MNYKKVKLHIWFDVACPYCYIAKKKLEAVITKMDISYLLDTVWHSFQLDPHFPEDTSMPSLEYLVLKKGFTPEQLTEIVTPLIMEGKAYNIDFDFKNSYKFNTSKIHRLLHWTKSFNKSEILLEAIMKASFCEGIDLSIEKNIFLILDQLGIDRITAKNVLDSDAYIDRVSDDIKQSQELEISAIPTFVSNNQKVMHGLPTESMLETIITEALRQELPSKSLYSQNFCFPNAN